jgi:hypothetical protein
MRRARDHDELQRGLRMNPRGVCALFAAWTAVLPLASAHQGHSDRAPWEACDDRALGSPCHWENEAHALHIGTCRSVADALVCVRQRPVVRVDPARPDGPPVGATSASGSGSPSFTFSGARWMGSTALALGVVALGLMVFRALRARAMK